jgi:8-oxo-dGTP pyrophosphatase MutT (NUDIX family)
VRLVLVDVEPPNGERFEHHVVRLGRIAIALVLDDQERVLTLYRHRFATDNWGYELLDGIVEPEDEPAATAAREVEEESGWRPVGAPEHLASFQPLPGMVDAPIDLFLWRGAERVGGSCSPARRRVAGLMGLRVGMILACARAAATVL